MMLSVLPTCARADLIAAGPSWSLKQDAGETATLEGGDGALTVRLTRGAKGPIQIAPAQPIDLPAGAKRLTIWADPASMGNAAPWRHENVALIARVLDGDGKLRRYPFACGSLNNRGWGRLWTESLTLPPDDQPWKTHPGAPFSLVGLEIQPGNAPVAAIRLQNLVAESDERTLANRPWQIVSLSDPFDRDAAYAWQSAGVTYNNQGWQSAASVPLDAVVDRPGSYRIAVRMRADWQGPIAAEWTLPAEVAADRIEADKLRPVALPVPKPGTYFVELRCWAADGSLAALRSFLLIAPETACVGPAPQGSGPLTRPNLVLRTERAGNVFAASETAAYSVQPRGTDAKGGAQLHLRVTDYGFNTLQEETNPLYEAPSGGLVVPKGLPAAAHGACRVFAELTANGKVIDRDTLILGKVTPGSAGPVRATAKPIDFPRGVTVSSMLINAVAPKGLDMLARVGRGMDKAILSGNKVVELELPWRDLEPLPGVYQFDMLDRMLDLAAQKGITAVVVPWLLSGHAPVWLYSHCTSYEDGASSLIVGKQFELCAADPVVRDAFARLWSEIARRYRGNAALGGFLTVGPSLDLGYWHDGLLHRTDYSPAAVESYRAYQRDVRHQSLDELARRYGGAYSSWSDVYPPVPSWDGDYDLRPQWVDFIDYQQFELARWMEGNFKAIRAEDPAPFIFQYQYVGYGPQEHYYPLFQKYRVGATTGGTESIQYLPFESTYSLWGLPSRGGETIQTVEKWNLYSSIFNMLSYGGQGDCYEVQWHTAFPEPWATEPDGDQILKDWSSQSEGGWLKRVNKLNFGPDFAKWSPIIRELGDTTPLPTGAGAFYSWDNNLYQMRWLNPYSISGWALLKAWEAKDHRLPQWISDETPLALFKDQKLLVVDSDAAIMSRQTSEKLAAYANEGGCLVAAVPAGRFTLETGAPDFGFVAALGVSGVRRSRDKSAVAAGLPGGLLAGQQLAFKSVYTARLPAGAQPLASLADGRPVAVRWRMGGGEVILLLGELDWEKSTDVLDALCRYKNAPRWCDVSDGRVHAYCLQKGDERYLIAHYRVYNYAQPLLNFVDKNPVQAKFSVLGLPEGAYNVRELNEGRDMGRFTAAQLAGGVDLGLVSGETKILRCTPAQ
jgi:hypothetical protein